MTINQLYKLLGKEIEKGHGRKPVLIEKATFSHPLGEVAYHPVRSIRVETHNVVDGDGYILERKDGTECLRTSLIVRGDNHGF